MTKRRGWRRRSNRCRRDFGNGFHGRLYGCIYGGLLGGFFGGFGRDCHVDGSGLGFHRGLFVEGFRRGLLDSFSDDGLKLRVSSVLFGATRDEGQREQGRHDWDDCSHVQFHWELTLINPLL